MDVVDPIVATTSNNKLVKTDDAPSVSVAPVLTNCLVREFWTDEVVDGGAFACFQGTRIARSCAPVKEVEVRHEVQRSVTFNAVVEAKEDDFEHDDDMIDQNSLLEEGICSGVGNGMATKFPRKNSDMMSEPKKLDDISLRLPIVEEVSTNKPLYITEEPEDIKQDQPLRRALCTNIRMRKKQDKFLSGHQQMGRVIGQPTSNRSRTSEPSESSNPSQQKSLKSGNLTASSTIPPKDVSQSTTEALPPLVKSLLETNPWKENQILSSGCPTEQLKKPSVGPRKQLSLKPVNREEETLNFYVEVEAMSAQLNGVRDLEEINAEDELIEERIEFARTSSLVDDDSAFMQSVNEETDKKTKVESPLKRPPHPVGGPKTKTGNNASFSLDNIPTVDHGSKRRGWNLPPVDFATGRNGRGSLPNTNVNPNQIPNKDPERTHLRIGANGTDRMSVVRKQTERQPETRLPPPTSEVTSNKSRDVNEISGRIPVLRQEAASGAPRVQQRIVPGNEGHHAPALRPPSHQNDAGIQKIAKEKNSQVNPSMSKKVVPDRILGMKLEGPIHDVHNASDQKQFIRKNDPDPYTNTNLLDRPIPPPKQYASSGWKTTTPVVPLPFRSSGSYDWNAGLMFDDEKNENFANVRVNAPQVGKGHHAVGLDEFYPDEDDQNPWEKSDIGYYGRGEKADIGYYGRGKKSDIGYYGRGINEPKERLSQPQRDEFFPVQSSWSEDARVPDAARRRSSQSVDQSLDYPIPYTSNREKSFTSRKSSNGSTDPKFDDNFWKEEEESDLDTAAFDVYGSENDSLFGDLKSTASGTSTDEISSKSSGKSERSPSGSLGTEVESELEYINEARLISQFGDLSKHSKADLSRYTDYSGSKSSIYSRYSRGDTIALTTYLQGDGQPFACVDKWLDGHE